MRLSADEAVAKARDYFAKGAPCSEAALRALQEVYGLEENVVAGSIGFGGGIGRCQSVCGAISGAIIALSHHIVASSADVEEARPKVSKLSKNLYRDFETKFGHTDCRSLTGYDFSAPGGYDAFRKQDEGTGQRFCNPFLEYVVRNLAEAASGS